MPEDIKPEELNKDTDMFKLLTDISKQNSDTIKLNTESITKLGDSQDTIIKSLGGITESLKNVHQSNNNNPVEAGLGMDQTPKISSDKDVGAKTTAPNAYAPDEHGAQGNEPGKDKGGLKMENKEDNIKKEDVKDTKKEETPLKKEDDKDKKDVKEEKKTEDKKDDKKEEKYKSFSYDNNTTIRPSVITKSFETYPDGYQIIKASLGGWGIEGIDADGAVAETQRRLNDGEFGHFGHDTGADY